MSILLYYFLPFILVLGILIFFHELGHFLVAKGFNVKVLKFSLGFGSKLVGKRYGETEYLISTVPLGGYVKMLGENDEEAEELSPEELEDGLRRAIISGQIVPILAVGMPGQAATMMQATSAMCEIER